MAQYLSDVKKAEDDKKLKAESEAKITSPPVAGLAFMNGDSDVSALVKIGASLAIIGLLYYYISYKPSVDTKTKDVDGDVSDSESDSGSDDGYQEPSRSYQPSLQPIREHQPPPSSAQPARSSMRVVDLSPPTNQPPAPSSSQPSSATS